MSDPTWISSEGKQPVPEQEVWLRAWCAVAGCWNCDSKDAPKRWADRCLEDFRKTFAEPNK